MTERDWDRELAKIDRQLASVSDDQLAKGPTAPRETTATPSPVRKSDWGVAIRVGLALALGVGILFWPYGSLCGGGLAGYLGAVVVIAGAGVWGAIASWRTRSPRAHLVSLLLVLWGAGLAAREVLPRAGYAREVREWACR